MALTNLQIGYLAGGGPFQLRIQSSIFKKALAIIEDNLANGGHYTAAQIYLAKQIATGQQAVSRYFALLACATNIIAADVTADGSDSTANDAALDSQVFTVVFTDLV